MASTYLQRTESAGNRKTFTWSAWVKRSNISSQMLAACSFSSTDEAYFFFDSSDKLHWSSSSASYGDVQTNRVFRDTNAWYHIVLAFDTTQATASNRIRFYVNGVEETSFATATYPSQDTQVYWNVGGTYYPRIGKRHASENLEFDGCMSHVVHIDGTQELPTIFGETDSTTGEWKIKTSITPSNGWGTNGYWILKDGNSVTDQSGNGNNWTVSGGTLSNTEDNPSNVFATLNPLVYLSNADRRFANGNTTISSVSASWQLSLATLGFTSGKFYWEAKVEALNSPDGYVNIGIQDMDTYGSTGNNTQYFASGNSNSAGFEVDYRGGTNNNNMSGGSNLGDTGIDYSNGDILGFAVDMDNRALYMHKNGTYITVGGNVGDPTSGASKTGAIAIPTGVTTCSPCVAVYGTNAIMNMNFGNGYFKTTAVSSAGTNASGLGIFEYDVPSGYTALCTKGLNL